MGTDLVPSPSDSTTDLDLDRILDVAPILDPASDLTSASDTAPPPEWLYTTEPEWLVQAHDLVFGCPLSAPSKALGAHHSPDYASTAATGIVYGSDADFAAAPPAGATDAPT